MKEQSEVNFEELEYPAKFEKHVKRTNRLHWLHCFVQMTISVTLHVKLAVIKKYEEQP